MPCFQWRSPVLALLQLPTQPGVPSCKSMAHRCRALPCPCRACRDSVRARLARPDFYQRYASPQYYWVNQGPTYTGPGAFAPVPVYQERAVLAPQYYHGRRYRYGYRHAHYHRGHVHRYHHGQRVLRYKY